MSAPPNAPPSRQDRAPAVPRPGGVARTRARAGPARSAGFGDQAEDFDRGLEPLELVPAALLEAQPAAFGEDARRSRHDDLRGTAERRDPRRQVDRDTADVVRQHVD